jgi:hypothetical protein
MPDNQDRLNRAATELLGHLEELSKALGTPLIYFFEGYRPALRTSAANGPRPSISF